MIIDVVVDEVIQDDMVAAFTSSICLMSSLMLAFIINDVIVIQRPLQIHLKFSNLFNKGYKIKGCFPYTLCCVWKATFRLLTAVSELAAILLKHLLSDMPCNGSQALIMTRLKEQDDLDSKLP